MLSKVFSCAVVGLDGMLVEVEVDVGTGNPGVIVVGLPDAAVQESRERVRSAIRNSGGRIPHGKITVNLAPADLKKAGPTYDLPIALGILIASGQLNAELGDALVVGELSLDGVGAAHAGHHFDDRARREQGDAPGVRAVRGRGRGGADSRRRCDTGPRRWPIWSITSAATCRSRRSRATRRPAVEMILARTDFAEIRGQEHVKRAPGGVGGGFT